MLQSNHFLLLQIIKFSDYNYEKYQNLIKFSINSEKKKKTKEVLGKLNTVKHSISPTHKKGLILLKSHQFPIAHWRGTFPHTVTLSPLLLEFVYRLMNLALI